MSEGSLSSNRRRVSVRLRAHCKSAHPENPLTISSSFERIISDDESAHEIFRTFRGTELDDNHVSFQSSAQSGEREMQILRGFFHAGNTQNLQRIELPEGAQMIAYADDLALWVEAKTSKQLGGATNE